MYSTYRIVESAEEVMKVWLSLGCHAQVVSSLTWPLRHDISPAYTSEADKTYDVFFMSLM